LKNFQSPIIHEEIEKIWKVSWWDEISLLSFHPSVSRFQKMKILSAFQMPTLCNSKSSWMNKTITIHMKASFSSPSIISSCASDRNENQFDNPMKWWKYASYRTWRRLPLRTLRIESRSHWKSVLRARAAESLEIIKTNYYDMRITALFLILPARGRKREDVTCRVWHCCGMRYYDYYFAKVFFICERIHLKKVLKSL
jgi:hypothetical protein